MRNVMVGMARSCRWRGAGPATVRRSAATASHWTSPPATSHTTLGAACLRSVRVREVRSSSIAATDGAGPPSSSIHVAYLNIDGGIDNNITLADICFVAELSPFHCEKARVKQLEKPGLRPVLHARLDADFPRAFAHFSRLRKHSRLAPDVAPYLTKFESASGRLGAQ